MADWDLQTLMLQLLEREKEYVRVDRSEYSCAMVVVFASDGGSSLHFPEYDSFESKTEAYAKIVEQAKSRLAYLIVTVNGAFTSLTVPDDYQWGDLSAKNAQPVILLTASGPAIQNTKLECPYTLQDGEVFFGELSFETEGVQINLLPGWPDEEKSLIH